MQDNQTIILTDEQQTAYDAIGKSPNLFLTGAAGCGKSIVITQKVKDDTHGKVILCAVTNKAASVLEDQLGTGVEIPTLHSVLGLKPVYDGSTKNSDDIVDFIFPTSARNLVHLIGHSLIIDEASMICLPLQQYILELLEQKNITSVTFVGDRYQLPCVKGDVFNYEAIGEIIELKKVQRAKGELSDYYNRVRKQVIQNQTIELYENATLFYNQRDFISYMKEKDESKIIITYTNEAASRYSSLIDSKLLYVGQECTSLSHAVFKHCESLKKVAIKTNFLVVIEKIFKNYGQMERDAIKNDYEFRLPKEPIGIEISNISYAKVINTKEETVYISVWDGTQSEKEDLYLNKFNREYRDFQDIVKPIVKRDIWNKYAKSNGYLKKLSSLIPLTTLPSNIRQKDLVFWNNFHVVSDAVILRSKYVSTAHRAQGITVNTVGIDLDNLPLDDDKKLAYVALTRASKELVFFKSKGA